MNLDFNSASRMLESYRLVIDASYFHGLLSGLICAAEKDEDIDDWMPTLINNRGYLDSNTYQQLAHEVLIAFNEVRSELKQDDFTFTLLLPDDSVSLEERGIYLSKWCEGFLTALVDYAETTVEELTEECIEFISDVANISQLETDSIGDDLNVNESFMTLEEHLKVGVQLIYETINSIEESDTFNTTLN